jgi:ribosome assembly protein SQT1
MTVLSGHTMPVTAGVFPPPAGRQLLTASLDSSLILWNPTTSMPMFKTSVFCAANAEMDPAEHGITALAVNPAGTIAAVGSAAGKVKLVSLPKGDVVGTLEGHAEGESIEALEFVDLLGGAGGGKGVVLVSGGTDGKGFVWDVATGRVRAELKHDVSEPQLSSPCHTLTPHRSPSPRLQPTPHPLCTSSRVQAPTTRSRHGTCARAPSWRSTRAMPVWSTAWPSRPPRKAATLPPLASLLLRSS